MKVDPLEFEKPIVELERRLKELRDQSEGHDLGLEKEIQKVEDKLA
ncbi:MAG: acetyl-CoA carboxylase carboxyl transferase subunit alpha, partial [Verrucomicrobiae bacterium]|nr:acetyl-CoA carboxylase carboxyl transferase subunit alpha [Verrucomicrobiae bacterium]